MRGEGRRYWDRRICKRAMVGIVQVVQPKSHVGLVVGKDKGDEK